jgi:hypothetical protein
MDEKKLKLDISMNIYLKREVYLTVFESTIHAESFKEAHEMLEKAEKFMEIEYEKYEDKK